MIRRLLSALLLAALLAPSSGYASAVQVEMLLGGLAASGVPLSGGKVYTYAAGDFTPAPTWSNSTKTATNTNPITLDINGRASVYAEGIYKFIIKDADGITVATYDNLTYMSPSNPTSMTIADMAATNGTISNLYSPRSILASSTISASLLSNSRLSGNILLEAPTAASHPVNLSYLNTQLASQTTYTSAISSSLGTHEATAINPHGSTLYQSTLVASSVNSIATTTSGGYFIPKSYGLDLFGDFSAKEAGIFFKTALDAVNDLFFAIATSPACIKVGSEVASKQITYYPYANYVDFGGASLTNLVFSPSAISYISSVISTPATGSFAPAKIYYVSTYTAEWNGIQTIPPSGAITACTLTVPNGYPTGVYALFWSVDLSAPEYHISGPVEIKIHSSHSDTYLDQVLADWPNVPSSTRMYYGHYSDRMEVYMTSGSSAWIVLDGQDIRAPDTVNLTRFRMTLEYLGTAE